MSSVVIHIDRFSGPMALLLHLIRKEEMDVFDINIHQITRQYLDSIKAMKKLNLEVAGDFIAMAATLIQIKSKMLLPQYDEHGEVLEQEDPRKDLVKRLLEYQMFQEAGHNLYKREILGKNVWARGAKEDLRVHDDSILLEEENALYSLIKAYRFCVKNMTKAVHRVSESLQSIADRILEMREKLIVGRTAKMSELVQLKSAGRESSGQLLITFLSLLELAKIGLVSLFQSENFVDIHVEAKGEISEASISSVENYDSQIHNASNIHEPVKEIWLSDEEASPVEGAVSRIDEQTSMLEVAEGIAPVITDMDVPATMDAPAGESVLNQIPFDEEMSILEMATDEDILLEEQRILEEEQKLSAIEQDFFRDEPQVKTQEQVETTHTIGEDSGKEKESEI